MSNQNHQASGNPLPPQNPIPNAQINFNPNLGRVGPVRTFPNAPHNRDGLPQLDQTSQPEALKLDKLKPVRAGPGAKSVKANEGTSTTGPTSEAADEDEDDEDEDEEEDDSDFELVEAPVYTPTDSPSLSPQPTPSKETEKEKEKQKSTSPPPDSPEQAYLATSLLTSKVPPELVDPIIEYAEYFPHSIIGSNAGEENVGNDPKGKTFMTAQIPNFDAMEDDTAGKGGDESMGRPKRVRRLVFKFKSRDQGWSSQGHNHKGTYIAEHSWIDVELWRRKASTTTEKGKGAEDASATDAVEMEMVDSSLLQRNKHATSDWTSYEIVWDWQEDDIDDEHPERWEEGPDGQGWYRNGRLKNNGKFVRNIRGGDEIRVIIRAQYAGWRCMAKEGSVECFWAV